MPASCTRWHLPAFPASERSSCSLTRRRKLRVASALEEPRDWGTDLAAHAAMQRCAHGSFLPPRPRKTFTHPFAHPMSPFRYAFRGGFCWFEQRLVQPTGGGPMRWKDTHLLQP